MSYNLPTDLTILNPCDGERACLDIEKIYDPYDATCKECIHPTQGMSEKEIAEAYDLY